MCRLHVYSQYDQYTHTLTHTRAHTLTPKHTLIHARIKHTTIHICTQTPAAVRTLVEVTHHKNIGFLARL